MAELFPGFGLSINCRNIAVPPPEYCRETAGQPRTPRAVSGEPPSDYCRTHQINRLPLEPTVKPQTTT